MDTRNIYLYQMMKSSNIELSKEETYLLSQLLNKVNDLDNGKLSISGFASELIRIMKRTSNFQKVDRVCFAIKLPLSNKLQIITSAMSDGEENKMDDSYSCYVSKDSSLFSISKEEMRVYDDINDIVEKFVDAGKPVQKSVFRLMKMGITSGLTMPVEFDDSFRGFLFFNSKEKNYFSSGIQNLDLFLCMLRVIFEKVLLNYLRSMTPALGEDSKLKEIYIAQSKMKIEEIEDVFQMCLFAVFKKKIGVEVDIKSGKAFVIPVGQSVFLLKKFYEIVPRADLGKSIELKLESPKDDDCAILSVPLDDIDFEALSSDELSQIRRTARLYGAEAIFSAKHFSMKFKVDSVDKNLFYSFAGS